jgi:hypothetical protein
MYTRLGWLVGLACCSVAVGAEWSVDDDLADNPDADFETIQEAVDAAADFDIIHVSPGTYTSNSDAVVTLDNKYLVLQATHDSNQTIIDGQDVRRGLAVDGGGSGGIYIIGFTITHCMAPDGESNEDQSGAALFARSGLVEFLRCNITSNAATGGEFSSGAMYCTDVDLVLEDCSMSANVANYMSAGISAHASNVTCRGCTFTNHQPIVGSLAGNGGVIEVRSGNGSSTLELSQCSFTSNASTGRGVVDCWGDVVCSSTEFRDNTSFGSALSMVIDTGATIEDCVFDGNKGFHFDSKWWGGLEGPGGAIYAHGGGFGQCNQPGGSPVEIINCDFLRNQSDSNGGAVYLICGTFTVTDCLFHDNMSASSGGGLSVGLAYSLDISDTTFVKNTASWGSAARFGEIAVVPSLVRVEACSRASTWIDGPVISVIDGDWSDEGDVCIMSICDPIPDDGHIGVHDLLAVLERYGESCEDCNDFRVDVCGNAANGESIGVVDLFDIEAVIVHWGEACDL